MEAIKDVASEENIAYFVINGEVDRKEVYTAGVKKHDQRGGRVVYRKSDSNHWFEILICRTSLKNPFSWHFFDVPFYGIIPPDAWISNE
jgi:hypothetical protein